VDTVKAVNPDTPVKGIATTMVATLDLLKRAAAARRGGKVMGSKRQDYGFCRNHAKLLDTWSETVHKGCLPNFGANLPY
jgi:hypothetical protein